MSDGSRIEWTEATWNPVTGCTKVSPGCDHCYIERTAAFRIHGRRFDGAGAGATTGVLLHPERLVLPLSWRRPRRIFVNSLSDLFHDEIPADYIARVFASMALTARHTFQLLTKRHARMRSLLNDPAFRHAVAQHASRLLGSRSWQRWQLDLGGARLAGDSGMGGGWTASPASDGMTLWWPPWPLPNVWLGVSVENQQWANIRIQALLDTLAAVRWLSCEPLLGPLDLSAWTQMVDWPACWESHLPTSECPRCIAPDWIVVGGETGPDARPMHPDWARAVRDQCVANKVPFFFKQHGDWAPIGPLYPLDDDAEHERDPYDEAHMEAVHLEVMEKREVVQLERDGYMADGHQPGDPRTWLMGRVGKKRAGRELDGRTWDEYPQAVLR